MTKLPIDLKKEHQNTLKTPRYKYSFIAKMFFFSLDLIAGKKDNLPKAKLLEILACIPYRVWEFRHYLKQTRKFKNISSVEKSKEIINWGRHAQDNEYTHLLVIHEKMKEDGIKDTWYLSPIVCFIAVFVYMTVSKILAFFNQKRAFLFNAEFENHAELVYAQLVIDNPQWEEQKLENALVKEYANVDTWADVFRQISLDERDHMNKSFEFSGNSEFMINYIGMPEEE